ncbi:MAG: cyclic nucleotide-binding domain-containing protein [bacterium]
MAVPIQGGSTIVRGKLKTKKRPVFHNVREFKPGEIIYKEGELGKEMLVIKEGLVKIIKNSSQGPVELAQLGPGSIVGEMSLLDNLPRSADIQAVEVTVVSIVNEAIFNSVIAKVPIWLKGIVKIITNRLRDANTKVGKSLLKDKVCGVVSLLLILFKKEHTSRRNKQCIDFLLCMEKACYICKISRGEFKGIVTDLVKRKIAGAFKDEDGKAYLYFDDLEILSIFVEYLRLKSQDKKMEGVEITEEAEKVLDHISYEAQKHGKSHERGDTLLPVSILLDQHSDMDTGVLNEFARKEIIKIVKTPEYGPDGALIFNSRRLRRIKLVKKWMPNFEMDFSR